VPNYRLQECQDSVPRLGDAPVMTLWASFRALFYVLWDEDRRKMVTFRTAAREG
jgi:omega-6 fatty acid desaturase (delta-12 desaturase)